MTDGGDAAEPVAVPPSDTAGVTGGHGRSRDGGRRTGLQQHRTSLPPSRPGRPVRRTAGLRGSLLVSPSVRHVVLFKRVRVCSLHRTSGTRRRIWRGPAWKGRWLPSGGQIYWLREPARAGAGGGSTARCSGGGCSPGTSPPRPSPRRPFPESVCVSHRLRGCGLIYPRWAGIPRQPGSQAGGLPLQPGARRPGGREGGREDGHRRLSRRGCSPSGAEDAGGSR